MEDSFQTLRAILQKTKKPPSHLDFLVGADVTTSKAVAPHELTALAPLTSADVQTALLRAG